MSSVFKKPLMNPFLFGKNTFKIYIVKIYSVKLIQERSLVYRMNNLALFRV